MVPLAERGSVAPFEWPLSRVQQMQLYALSRPRAIPAISAVALKDIATIMYQVYIKEPECIGLLFVVSRLEFQGGSNGLECKS